ncbi:helix-turn-helix domain-containing protein [Streptomyces apocyni]|uniref:helix-turn-helix domain-containing protein n=1 Tax=Streptomyces apocyni TaxID=2654677 RepID=UPI0012EAD7AC|nr:Scr1 family TA system antitoxin-like transcriptional regulator [Streptomyces apocyni]
MAARKPPTERQRRLGAELRTMREHAGLSINDAAVMHGTDRTSVTNVETGRAGVSTDRVRVWAANYSCADSAYIDALAGMARERRAGNTNWWDEYRGTLPAVLLDIAELEYHAVAIRAAQLTNMPGLLQHEDYVRAVFEEAVVPLAPADFERKLAFRLRRSEVIEGPRALPCTFLVHEAALRMRFGGLKVVRTQLAYLLEQSERENVTLRVLPFEAGGTPLAAGSTQYVRGPVPRLDTVQSDTPVGVSFQSAEAHLANYRVLLDRMEKRALAPKPSRDFIRELARQL